jgi:tetratricopeptide (TPR) repeat protein
MRVGFAVASFALIFFVRPIYAEPPTKEQIARWITELGDEMFATREQASKRLWEAGEAAEAAVAQATKSADVEVSRRARVLANKFKWGYYPGTPPQVVECIDRYRAANDAGKQAVIKELFTHGSAGCNAILKIASAEDDIVRPRIFQQIAQDTMLGVPGLLVEGKLATLEKFLEISMAAETFDAITNYAAVCLMQGKLDERIAVYEKRAAVADSGRAREVLLYLQRAKGDHAAARKTAATLERADLEEALLAEIGDWKSLAKMRPSETGRPLVALGFHAAYQRLAGDTTALEETIQKIRTSPEVASERDWGAWAAARALLLNDRPKDALDLLKSHRRTAVFELLCAQLKFREGFALIDKVKSEARPEIDVELTQLEILQARMLYLLGEKEKAVKLFTDLGNCIRPDHDFSWYERLVEAERRVGLKELTCDHSTRMLAITKNPGRQGSLFDKLFPGQGENALQWWQFLRRSSGEEPAQTMKRLCDLLEGKTRGKALDDLIGSAKVLHPDAANARWMLCISDVYLNADMADRAKEYLDAAMTSHVSTAPYIRFGDYLVQRKQWEQAEEQYGRAWDMDRKEPLPLYLRGWAMANGGKEQEGKRLMELSHWLPLGNEATRFTFMTGLAKRRQTAAVVREAEMLRLLSVPGSFYAGESARQLSLDAYRRRDYAKAAALHELAMYRCLRPQTSFQETAAYLGVPHFVHRCRAAGLLAAGNVDDAMKEAEICLAAMPGNSDLQTLLVPGLEARGRRTEADNLFNRCYDPHTRLCAEYPNSAWAHNSLAWLCASTRRNLDVALEHANRAVTLEPGNAGYHDTLAETQFQRGDKEQAIGAIRKAIGLDGKRTYFAKQLKRFEAGDPKAALPSAGEED